MRVYRDWLARSRFQSRLIAVCFIVAFAGLGYTILRSSRAANLSISMESYATGLSQPTDVTGTGASGDKRLFVTEKEGRLRVVHADGSLVPTPALDLSDEISVSGERGLLGITFHPQYAVNG
jgi:glucose/arabinose dehydrogenase